MVCEREADCPACFWDQPCGKGEERNDIIDVSCISLGRQFSRAHKTGRSIGVSLTIWLASVVVGTVAVAKDERFVICLAMFVATWSCLDYLRFRRQRLTQRKQIGETIEGLKRKLGNHASIPEGIDHPFRAGVSLDPPRAIAEPKPTAMSIEGAVMMVCNNSFHVVVKFVPKNEVP